MINFYPEPNKNSDVEQVLTSLPTSSLSSISFALCYLRCNANAFSIMFPRSSAEALEPKLDRNCLHHREGFFVAFCAVSAAESLTITAFDFINETALLRAGVGSAFRRHIRRRVEFSVMLCK